MNVLENQYKEINSHVRHVAQLIVTWYTFFVTANIVALGWFATTDQTKAAQFAKLTPWLIGLFFFVNILGCAALLYVRSYFHKENSRLEVGLTKITEGDAGYHALNGSPLPLRLYECAVSIMIVSLLAIAVVWCVLGGIV